MGYDDNYRRRRQEEVDEKFSRGRRTRDYDSWLWEQGYVNPYSGRYLGGETGGPYDEPPYGGEPPAPESRSMPPLDYYYRALKEAHEVKRRLLDWIEHSDQFKPYTNSEVWLVRYRGELWNWIADLDPDWPGSAGRLADYLNQNPGLANYGQLFDRLREFKDFCAAVNFSKEMLR
ncbi:MAG: hypothetical protein ABR603_10900 [Pyrinomonadaceae bacterium]